MNVWRRVLDFKFNIMVVKEIKAPRIKIDKKELAKRIEIDIDIIMKSISRLTWFWRMCMLLGILILDVTAVFLLFKSL